MADPRERPGTFQVFAKEPAVGIAFGSFVLDLDTRQLMRGGVEVRLSPKAFTLLSVLLEARPKVLSKAVLQERLWPGTYVSEANLSNLVTELRAALHDSPRAPTFIRTAYGVGYAFAARVAGSADSEDTSHWLEWAGRRIPLPSGEHVVGRDESAGIRMEHSTISRRHARFIVTAETTVLEDCASKNGTFRGSERLTAPVRLDDGDEIRIGSVLVTFHTHERAGTTATYAGQDS